MVPRVITKIFGRIHQHHLRVDLTPLVKLRQQCGGRFSLFELFPEASKTAPGCVHYAPREERRIVFENEVRVHIAEVPILRV